MPIAHASFSISAEELEYFAGALRLLPDVSVTMNPVSDVPGLWAKCGATELHLNARLDPSGGVDGPTSPIHICFAVPELQSVASRLVEAGFDVVKAGSLDVDQYWIQGPGAFRIELQSET